MAYNSSHPSNYAPMTRRSQVAHQPGQAVGDKIKDGRDYSVEFDDHLHDIDGWTNPRYDGSEVTSLYKNRYSPKNTPRALGGIVGEHIQHLAAISRSWTGDINLDKNPVVQTYTNSIAYGTTIAGYQEDRRYPNVGPDFSYIFITKILTFDPDTDEFFTTELLGPEDEVFERMLKQDFMWSDKFSLKLLDDATEHDLKDEYSVHWNQGLFSLIATYVTCSEAPYSHEQGLLTQYVPSSKTKYYGVPIPPYSLYTQNIAAFHYNNKNRVYITGSFTVEKNPDTWWWRKPRTSSYFNGSGAHESASGDLSLGVIGNSSTVDATGSLFRFLDNLAFQTASEPHTLGFHPKNPPAFDNLHILTFNEAEDCDRRFQTEMRYGRNTTQALRHFGSISLSPGRKIRLPNCYLGSPKLGNFSGQYYIESKIVGANFNEYTIQSSSNFANGLVYTWLNNDALMANKATYPGNNDAQYDVPGIKTYTISKMEKRLNVIMADVNKIDELFDGVGNKGFICIPEKINPTIKNNLEYFLKKADLIDKGPRRKGVGSQAPRLLRNIKRMVRGHLPTPGKIDYS